MLKLKLNCIIGKHDWTIPNNQILHTKVESCVYVSLLRSKNCLPDQLVHNFHGILFSINIWLSYNCSKLLEIIILYLKVCLWNGWTAKQRHNCTFTYELVIVDLLVNILSLFFRLTEKIERQYIINAPQIFEYICMCALTSAKIKWLEYYNIITTAQTAPPLWFLHSHHSTTSPL